MLAFKIEENQIKNFMNKLLKESTFDEFNVRGIEIVSFTRFEISGILQKDYFEDEVLQTNYCTWGQLRPIIYNLIKSYKKPKTIKIIFSLAANYLEKIHPNTAACFINLMFEGNEIQFTTTATEKNFTMDKTVNINWADYVRNFFDENGIIISTLT